MNEDSVNSISFNFYYQIIINFMKQDKKDDFYRMCLDDRCFLLNPRRIILVAQILLAFKHENELDIYKEINKIIQEQLSSAIFEVEATRRRITKMTLVDEKMH